MSFPLGAFLTQVGLCGGWWSTDPVKTKRHLWHLQTRKKSNLSKSDKENEIRDLPSFIVSESLEEVCLAKFSPIFLIERLSKCEPPPKSKENMEWKLVC